MISSRLEIISAAGRTLPVKDREAVKSELATEASSRFPVAWEIRSQLLDLKKPTGTTGSQETHDAYERDLLRFFCWALDVRGRDPLTLEQGDLVAYLHNLEGSYSSSSIRRHFAAVSAFYKQAMVDNRIATSPVVNIPLPAPKSRARNSKPDARAAERARIDLGLDAEAAAAIVTQARHSDPGTRALIMLLIGNGLRVSEACRIQVEDVLPARRGTREIAVTGKGDKVDVITLAAETAEAVDEAIDGRKRGELCLRPKKNGELVPYNRNSARRAVIQIATDADISTEVWPHRLRHTFVTLAIDGGVPLQMVSRHARHSSIETTMRYSRAMGDGAEHSTHAVMEAVEAVTKNGSNQEAPDATRESPA